MPEPFSPLQALKRLQSVVPPEAGSIPLHEPLFQGREWDYVKSCIDEGWVSSVGSFVSRFEQDVAKACGRTFGIAVVNGTAALHVSLLLAGVEMGDEVLIPALSFIATANAVSYCNAVPHFCDVEERTLGLDPARLDEHLEQIAAMRDGVCVNRQTGRVIRALVPMHCFGHPADLDGLSRVADNWGLVLIEDAAESLGSRYKGRPVGRHGLFSALSFNGNKIVTTGGGGVIATDDEELAGQAKHLTTTAKVPHAYRFDHDRTGFNYRMPNINAALGVAQLEQLEDFLTAKRQLADRYAEMFHGLSGARIFTDMPEAQSNCWLIALILDEADMDTRNAFLELCNGEGYGVRPVWTLLHRHEMYRNTPRMDLSVSIDLEARIINLPSSVRHGRGG